ncbi:MAG: helix-turn-helix domain-containing protein [Patescibacteria group bacterium]|nr:helix-turn-helix domain-containing protein [Patescibacteria group bacterium]
MNNTFFEFIKVFRKRAGFTQKQVADKIGISRPSYIAIEQGKRELNLSEAEKLADIFGISIEDFFSGNAQDISKYKQMIFAFLRNSFANGEKIPKTKLAKFLYLADFGWYYNHFESMSGMRYRKIQYGPVPDVYFRVVEELYEDGKLDIERTKGGAMLISQTKSGEREKTNLLNNAEKKLIQNIFKKWKDKRTPEIVDFTHNQLPYKLCSDGEIIPYALITQEDPEYVY